MKNLRRKVTTKVFVEIWPLNYEFKNEGIELKQFKIIAAEANLR